MAYQVTIFVQHSELILQMWWMHCAALVLLMLYGFHLLESGWARRRHISGIATKNTMMFLASSVAYTLFGHALMYGEDWQGLCGKLGTLDAGYWGNARFWFQTGFASVAATIISGAIVGRTTLFSNVVAAALIAGVIYPIHGHWIWHEDGILYGRVIDYAGSGVVHVVGGTAALVACLFAKRPEGKKPDVLPNGNREQTPGFAAGGVLLLIIGWIGFNGGSITAYRELVGWADGHFMFIPAKYVQNTILAAASGALIAYVWSRIMCRAVMKSTELHGPYTFHTFNVLSGTMAGMVAVSASCNRLTLYTALAVGAVGGLACCVVSMWMAKAKLIDTVDAVAVHLGGGLAGLFCAGIAVPCCIGWQLVDMFLACAFTAANMAVACWILLHFPGERDLMHAKGDWAGIKHDPIESIARVRLWVWALGVSIPIACILPVFVGLWDGQNVLTNLALLAPVVAVSIKVCEKKSPWLFTFLRKP